jgi:hypothetical protein
LHWPSHPPRPRSRRRPRKKLDYEDDDEDEDENTALPLTLACQSFEPACYFGRQCPNFGARHLCRFTIQSNQGVEAG